MPLTPRQEEILDSALLVVRDKGLSGLTVRGLARQVGVTEGALYRHFPGKREIILGMIDKLEQLLLEPIREIASDHSRTPRARLELLLRHHARVIADTDSLPILLLGEVVAAGDTTLSARMGAFFENYLALLETLVDEQTGGRAPVPSQQAALALLGLIAAHAIRRRLAGALEADESAPFEAIDFLVERLTRKQR